MDKTEFGKQLSDSICENVTEIINDQWLRALGETLADHTKNVKSDVNKIVSTYDKKAEGLKTRHNIVLAGMGIMLIATVIGMVIGFVVMSKKDDNQELEIKKISNFIEELGAPVMTERGLKFFPADFTGDTITKKR